MTEVFQELDRLLTEYEIPRRGVLHAGAHEGQEVPVYRGCGFDLIRLVEPNPELAWELPRDCDVIEAAVAEHGGKAALFIPKWDQQASILRPASKPVERGITVTTVTLRLIQDDCDLLVMDVQGSELKALKGADLTRFSMLVVETCTEARYIGAAVHGEVVEWLASQGWRLTERFHHKYRPISDCVFVR